MLHFRVQLFATPWNSPGKNTGVGSHSLLQGMFWTQGSNPSFLHCRRILLVWATRGRPQSQLCSRWNETQCAEEGLGTGRTLTRLPKNHQICRYYHSFPPSPTQTTRVSNSSRSNPFHLHQPSLLCTFANVAIGHSGPLHSTTGCLPRASARIISLYKWRFF